MLGIAMTPLANELRRLNGIGAAAGSRGERVRTVKQALARRGDGPNRCC
jgi:transcription antitermination factor NusA-like protein